MVALDKLVRMPCPICDCTDSRPERMLDGYALERCSACSMVYMNPRYSEEELGEIYTHRETDDLVELYARIATPSVLGEYDTTLDALERLLPGKGRLLDFACAAGYFFERAQKRGWDAHGVDIGEWTKVATDRRGVKNMHVGALAECGFPDHHFDVVYAAQAFEHLIHPRIDLAEMRRICRPGGLIYIDVPNYRTLSIVLRRDDFELNTPPQHINFFGPETLDKLLRDAGLEVLRLTSSGGLKWENLLGRRINSDIAAAYDVDHGVDHGREADLGGGESLAGRLKGLVRRSVVQPVFYDRLKVGMVLAGIARRP